MITIDVSDIKNEKDELAEFLQSKLKTSIKINGDVLLIEDSNNAIRIRDVKANLKRYLYHKGFSEKYRVIVNRKIIQVLKVDTRKKRKTYKDKGRVPHPAETMPWFFPWRT